MAKKENDKPYSQFNFGVEINDITVGGFQEVTGLGLEVNVAEYRAGDSQLNSPLKVPGTYKVPDVTLKRGVMGDGPLWTWLSQVRDGNHAAKNVTINLYDETGQDGKVAQTWELTEAVPIKYTGAQLSGKGTDVAIEEFVLSCEHLEMKF